jgi:hypothetical protein
MSDFVHEIFKAFADESIELPLKSLMVRTAVTLLTQKGLKNTADKMMESVTVQLKEVSRNGEASLSLHYFLLSMEVILLLKDYFSFKVDKLILAHFRTYLKLGLMAVRNVFGETESEKATLMK